ncbi:helix-turn-helix transcriptional regulator [Dyadobacter tibetensis]|uniref:helix-turn-helix transcriptional regulator n=1 Tax=Dyadobacter tibetensis TaxID=1211851 RepID=UPI000471B1C6|nr:WYL domain-containing protein [Dyadobacter tibetensis]
MSDIPKTERILRLIRILHQNKRTIEHLALLLSTTPRTIYRDILVLQNVGYVLEKDEQNRYYLGEQLQQKSGMFTLEETRLVRMHLSGFPANHPLKASIERKLYLSSELIPLADDLADKQRAGLISKLEEAIQARRRVTLLRYHSNHSATVTDRLVEPLGLTDDFGTLNAYEVCSGIQKTFKVHRMEDVEISAAPIAHQEEPPELDLFGFTGPEPILVQIRLSFLAHNLLYEEFPGARGFISKTVANDQDIPLRFPYTFRYEVRDFRGIGRFLLGLPGEVQIHQPEELKQFLKKKRNY